jgi:hypothetical protein
MPGTRWGPDLLPGRHHFPAFLSRLSYVDPQASRAACGSNENLRRAICEVCASLLQGITRHPGYRTRRIPDTQLIEKHVVTAIVISVTVL